MTIPEAIKAAIAQYDWTPNHTTPTSVVVVFDAHGHEDETELDLYSDQQETELNTLWSSLCAEMNSTVDGVISVQMCG